jgi:hypothetical protein
MASSLTNGLFGFSPCWSWFSKAVASCHWTEYLNLNSRISPRAPNRTPRTDRKAPSRISAHKTSKLSKQHHTADIDTPVIVLFAKTLRVFHIKILQEIPVKGEYHIKDIAKGQIL